jgi:hypothetical protein
MLYILQNLNLPNNIINIIFTYLSTPTADLIRTAYKYIYTKIKYKELNNSIELDDIHSYKHFGLDYFHITKRNFEEITKTVMYKDNIKYCINYKYWYFPKKLNFTYFNSYFSSIELFFLYITFWSNIDYNIYNENNIKCINFSQYLLK